MSDISIHKLGDKEYALVTVPKDAQDFDFWEEKDRQYISFSVGQGTEGFDLLREEIPAGEWELVGKGSELSFVDWAGIIESEHDGSGTLTRWYKNYVAPDNMFYGHPKESGLSWLKSLSYDPETIVIIRKIK